MKYLRLSVFLLVNGLLSVACNAPLGQLDSPLGVGPQYPVEITIPGGDGRGLIDDIQVTSVVVQAVDGSGTSQGSGSLVKVSGVWKGTFNVDVAALLTFRAQARDSAGLPLWEGSTAGNVAPTGTTTVNIMVGLLPSSVGANHSSFGRGSPVDLNGGTAGTGWSAATFSKGSSFTSGYGGNLQVGVYSANAEKVLLEIYSQGTEKAATLDYWMEKGSDNVWRAVVDMSGNTSPVLYAFRVWGPNWPYNAGWTRGNSSLGFSTDVDTNGHRFNPNKVLYDPYTKEMSHDKETPELTAALENGAIFGTGGVNVDVSQTYSGPLTGNLPIDRRNVDTGKWAPKSVALVDSTSFGTKPAIAQKDSIIYEAHVRGLTKDVSSTTLATILSGFTGFESVVNVPDAYRGTYKGAAYMAKYLKALGYTTIELLPVHETANDTNPHDSAGGNYWGYMTYGYFAPDRRYSYDKTLGGPTKEFKEMVAAFHSEGLEVYLDVVYNHTGEGGVWGGTGNTKDVAELTSFRGFDNAEYYALGADKTVFWETTGCGNNFDASKTVVKDLIKDSLVYWTTNMGVDGFRFDLAPVLGRDSSTTYAYNPNAALLTDIAAMTDTYNVEMIAEAWDTQWTGGYQVSNFPNKWGEWNGFYRDAVRKFIKGGGNKTTDYPSFTDVFHGSYGPLDRPPSGHVHTGFNDQGGPQKSVNFIVAHDGLTLADLVSYDNKTNVKDVAPAWPFGPSDGGNGDDAWGNGGVQSQRRQQIRNLWAIQMFSRGVPMTVYGDEFGRTQNGNSNPYNVDSIATWNNYAMINTDAPQAVTITAGAYDNNLGTDGNADTKNNLFLFAQSMIQTRKNEPALRSADYLTGFSYTNNSGGGLITTDRCVRIQIDGSSVSGGSDYLLAINSFSADVNFTIPAAAAGKQWVRIVDTGTWAEANNNYWSPESGAAISGTYGVKAYSLCIFKEIPEPTPPSVGTSISFGLTTSTAINVTWGAGTDNLTTSGNLAYKVVRAPSSAEIDTLAEVNAIAGAALVQDWATEGATPSALAGGLTSSTTYWFAVVVKDEAGNMALYSPLSHGTGTSGETTPPTPGTGLSVGTRTGVSLGLSWGAGTDNTTTPGNLLYKVVQAGTSSEIDTVAEAEVATTVMNWSLATTSVNATGLNGVSTYAFAVLIQDEAGNIALYSPTSGTTMFRVSVNLPNWGTLSDLKIGKRRTGAGVWDNWYDIQTGVLVDSNWYFYDTDPVSGDTGIEFILSFVQTGVTNEIYYDASQTFFTRNSTEKNMWIDLQPITFISGTGPKKFHINATSQVTGTQP